MSKFKHLTHEQRVLIEDRLNHHISIRSIASELNKSPSTILREIQNHSTKISTQRNNCIYRRQCDIKHLCKAKKCTQLCCKCYHKCNSMCSYYKEDICIKLTVSPYTCNGCKAFGYCEYNRNIYKSTDAQQQYRDTLVDTRSGFDLTNDDFHKIDQLVSPLIKNGQSLYHITQTLGDELTISESTLRRMIESQSLSARNIDLREQVKRKPRKKSSVAPLSVRKLGHFYSDYLNYIEENDVFAVQMDCVEGKKNENAALLTLTIPPFSLQLAFIMNTQTCNDVVSTLDMIETSLGTDLFTKIFPIILTDNGHEFEDIEGMERSCLANRQRTRIFFCEPNRSDEKGSCENHHKMIRYIIPKGTSLEPYYQSDISLMMNHINSYKRKALFVKSAYEVAKSYLPEDFFILLGLEEIPPNRIILRPSLLR